MDVLVIDDLRKFIFPAVYARNVEDGLFWIDQQPWREVWLDHDLGGEETIRPVVNYIEELAYDGRLLVVGKIVIHTSNRVGRRVIDSALGKWYDTVHRDAALYLDL